MKILVVHFISPIQYQGRSPWEQKILAALRTYRDLNGDLLVPQSLVIPTGDERWPSVTWGYKLGTAVRDLRWRLQSKSPLPTGMKEELEKMSFVKNMAQYKWDNIVLPALQRQFRRVHGHADVPTDFVVPTGDEAWPELAWGFRLGGTVSRIRRVNAYRTLVAASKEELDRMGFCYDMTIAERDWKEKILPAFQVYRQEFGDCIVGYSFTVPSCPPWPEKAWKMPLGVIVHGIRTSLIYAEQVARDKDVLDALGFAWSRGDAVWSEILMPTLQAYVNVYGDGNIPIKFEVPSEDPWPRKTWGKKLGMALYQMRHRGQFFAGYGHDIDKLDELGVNIKLSSQAWDKRVVPLLEVYAELYVDEEVPADFVVPSEDPWEKKLWGVRLGLIVARNSQFMARK
ncbi:hypothetical protein PHYSODRAFT_496849 [Phytophthora sojae]|uniref:Uncharacterized protein n=1 Tax=Phytophthora sojae (strain P6497) TaxID=1094619 RepID=G4Z7V3_PHYSP|nr:hypothetical protein PHYSODRAFT_496849 [Phytophthora sojae]EGZ22488.1 hypothetical protein PHYSODRAFT_496849 [Phytophthora sojae]|eukprot:XP_009525205.1 hypothetical protein PHYSODRAFT_496849 [Phytophthora sojae]